MKLIQSYERDLGRSDPIDWMQFVRMLGVVFIHYHKSTNRQLI